MAFFISVNALQANKNVQQALLFFTLYFVANKSMTEPTLHAIACPAGHTMAYWQWGAPDATHAVICVHGLSRQGRDFDVLAQALLERAGGALRVICPDVAGRGHSSWLADPALYQIPTYVADMHALIHHLHAQAPLATLDWVGTSMGGLIGLGVCGAGLPLPLPVRRLVLNDVGPRIEWASLQRIAQYVGQPLTPDGRFTSLQAAADALWAISSSFGPHTPAQWLALSRHMLKPVAATQAGLSSTLALHYDPAIGAPFRAMTPESSQAGEAALWALYDAITAPTLLLRGASSDLLSPATAHEMGQRGPRARLVEFAGVGHAPTLVAPGQSQVVVEFLLAA